MIALLVLLAVPFAMYSQNAASGQEGSTPETRGFEVASIKPSVGCGSADRSPTISPGSLRLRCVTLRGLLRGAYSIAGGKLAPLRVNVVGGPSWLDSEHFDVSAKAEGPASQAEMMGPLMRVLLEERFKVKVHRESKEASVYSLTAREGELKLRPSKPGGCTPFRPDNKLGTGSKGGTLPRCGQEFLHWEGSRTIVDWQGIAMPELARDLSAHVDRQVVDKTRIVGEFDVHLEFARDSRPVPVTLNGELRPAPPADDDPSSPSIFTALRRQLGLALVPDKHPVDVIVVESAEKPSGN